MTDNTCPSCGKPLPAGAPHGLCPECLIRSGFNTGTAPSGPSGAAHAGAFAPLSLAHLQPLFPHLEILELIGAGGMGAVYKARQPGLDRFVALKVLAPAAAGDPAFADRFKREARALARLQHPRIVTVHDVGVAGGLHYLVMEYVDGPNLRQVQRSGGLTPAQALRIVQEICEALQFAHDRGIVHRDIKPENLLLDRDGHVKITDFGIAKLVGPSTGTTAFTATVDVVGTPHYMAPEQIERPGDVDHRADIYSLGVVFYELLTGELPLGRFAPPSKRVQLDVRLDEVILRSLEKEPERRYQQASQVKNHLDTIAGSPAAGLGAGGIRRRRSVNAVPAMTLYGLQAGFLVVAQTLFWPFFAMGGGQLPFPTAWGPWGPSLLATHSWGHPSFWSALHMIALLGAYIAWGVLHHACWSSLPQRYRATTPGKAAGLLFVPFFNFYWVFVSFGRLADGFNSLGDDRPELAIKDASGLAIAKALSFVAVWTIGWLPGISSVVSIVDAVLFVLYYRAIAFNANQASAVTPAAAAA